MTLNRIKITFYILIFLATGLTYHVYADSKSGNSTLFLLKEKFEQISNYSVTMVTKSKKGTTIIKYIYKKPGFVKMTFVIPHEGATLVYSPESEEAVLRPFKTFKSMSLSLKADNILITSPGGHTIDRSDVGTLISNLIKLSQKGSTHLKTVEDKNNSRLMRMVIKGKNNFSIEGINTYHIDFNSKDLFPNQVISFDTNGTVIEEMTLKELLIDQPLPDNTFF